MSSLGCGTSKVFIYTRGRRQLVGELPGVSDIRWNRTRDDISNAQVTVATSQCCEMLNSVECVINELHIVREGVTVWHGPITRIEYGRDVTNLFAQDMMWVASRTALAVGYDYSAPNQKMVGEVMRWLLWDNCFKLHGDPWRMKDHIHWVQGPDEPRTSRAVNAYSTSVWEDFDKFAEDNGTDYATVGTDVYIFDTNLAWNTIPDLKVDFIGGWPEVVEYGNELATRAIYTNGTGLTTIRTAPQQYIDKYGYIDEVITATGENAASETVEATDTETMVVFKELAGHALSIRLPTPLKLRLPSGTQLLPDAPYDINELIPGSWLNLVVRDDLCRDIVDRHKLDEVSVEETQENGEVVSITTTSAPLLEVGLEEGA